MRSIIRVPSPKCLGAAQPSTKWDELAPTCKEEIRESLGQMSSSPEGPLCHYCESAIQWKSNRHSIEHLYPRNRFPDKTLEWSNLYLSCKTPDHCDQYKDAPGHQSYDPADLVRPDIDNPDAFFQFLPDGRVIPRSDIACTDRDRAETTISVLGLNAPRLVTRRRAVAAMAEAIVAGVAELEGLTPAERNELLLSEMQDANEIFSRLAHGTVARQFFIYFN